MNLGLQEACRGGGILPTAAPNTSQGFSPKGYNPQPEERTVIGYVKSKANPEIALYTKSAGYNNDGNVGGKLSYLDQNRMLSFRLMCISH